MWTATVVTFALASTAGHLQTTVDEVAALQKRKQHAEVLQRGTDVAPTARGAKWAALITTSALQISADDAQRSPLAAYGAELDRVRAYPHLLDDAKYRVQYERVLTASTTACFDRVSTLARAKKVDASTTFGSCARRGERLIDDKATSHKSLRKLASILWRGGDRNGSVRAIEQTLARQQRAQRQPVCESELAERTVEFGFRQPHDTGGATAARNVAFKFCEAVFREEIIHELARSPRQEVYDNACPALLANPKAGKLLKKRCEKAQLR